MRNIILISLLLISTVLHGQHDSSLRKNKHVVYQIDTNLFDVVIIDGAIKQTGQYILINNELKMHGYWVLKSNKKVLTKAFFDKGTLLMITSKVDGFKKTYNIAEIEKNRQDAKIYKSENMLLSIKTN